MTAHGLKCKQINFEIVMKAFCIGLLLALSTGFTVTNLPGELVHRLIVQPSSRLSIDGKTNLNSFACAISKYVGKDTLVLVESRRKKPVFRQGYVGLSAASFDCGMQIMTRDFAETIKAKQYPNVAIEFISFERAPHYEEKEDQFKGRMKISLAGVTRSFDVDCSIRADDRGLIHLKGGRDFTFSDFDLEAPSKMMGMVKVHDSIQVNFHLVLRIDENS